MGKKGHRGTLQGLMLEDLTSAYQDNIIADG